MSLPRFASRAALLLALAPAGCGAPLRCDPTAATVSGEMGRDVVGAWQSTDAAAPRVYEFGADGTVSLIDPPTGRAPGAIRSGRYAVADDLLTLELPGAASHPTPIAITETLLIGLGPDHRRVVCSGYGF
jgi:hypothetical protein